MKKFLINFILLTATILPQSSLLNLLGSTETKSGGSTPGNVVTPVNPATLSNIRRLLTSGSIQVSYSYITSWMDSSYSYRDLNAVYGNPDTTSLNGYRAASFNVPNTTGLLTDGSSYAPNGGHYTTYDLYDDLTTWTWVGVFKTNAVGIIDRVGSSYGSAIIQLEFVNADSIRIYLRDENSAIAQAGFTTTNYDNTWGIFVYTWDGPNHTVTVYSYKGEVASATNPSLTKPMNTGYAGGWYPTIGMYDLFPSTKGDYWTGAMAYDVIYTDVKSKSDINSICQWLAQKYNLTWTSIQ